MKNRHWLFSFSWNHRTTESHRAWVTDKARASGEGSSGGSILCLIVVVATPLNLRTQAGTSGS